MAQPTSDDAVAILETKVGAIPDRDASVEQWNQYGREVVEAFIAATIVSDEPNGMSCVRMGQRRAVAVFRRC